MKEEVIIVPGKPENVFKGGRLDGDFEKWVFKWDAYAAIRREPQYVAYFVIEPHLFSYSQNLYSPFLFGFAHDGVRPALMDTCPCC
jgi:hypothetical protein